MARKGQPDRRFGLSSLAGRTLQKSPIGSFTTSFPSSPAASARDCCQCDGLAEGQTHYVNYLGITKSMVERLVTVVEDLLHVLAGHAHPDLEGIRNLRATAPWSGASDPFDHRISPLS